MNSQRSEFWELRLPGTGPDSCDACVGVSGWRMVVVLAGAGFEAVEVEALEALRSILSGESFSSSAFGWSRVPDHVSRRALGVFPCVAP